MSEIQKSVGAIVESMEETTEPRVLGIPCPGCGLPKTTQTMNCFHRDSHVRSGLRAHCKTCEETTEPRVLGISCPGCGLPKTTQTMNCFHRDSHVRSGLRARCKTCYEKKRKEARFQKAREASRPPAPDGYAYCKRCGDEKGPRPIALFPYRDGPNSKRRGVCSPCFDAARKATRLANRKALAALPEPVRKIDLAMVAAIKLESLNAMRKKKKEKKLDPIMEIRLLYWKAWRSIRRLPWPIDSRIRGRMTVM